MEENRTIKAIRRLLHLPKLFKKELDTVEIQQAHAERDIEENAHCNELVTFNVSGTVFKTLASTLNNFPTSVFGSKRKRDRLLRTEDGAIFLNRNAQVFEKVLDFCRTGIFECPGHINQKIFMADVKYYGLDREAITCGIHGFMKPESARLDQNWRDKLWTFLESPDSSLGARCFSLFSISVILGSVVAFCLETLPKHREEQSLSGTSDTVRILDRIEVFCISWFTFEFVIRLLASPNKCMFAKDWLNIVDLISILPFLMSRALQLNGQVSTHFLRVVRLTRVFRVFKLSRHTIEMQVLAMALRDSLRELGALLFFVLIGTLLFSSAMFYAEFDNDRSKIQSIPGAFWLSVVTMTTVGYGDVVPVTSVGRFVSGVCSMIGILLIALPIPIIVNNFTRQYNRMKPVPVFFNAVKQREKRIERRPVVGLYTAYELGMQSDIEFDTSSFAVIEQESETSENDITTTLVGMRHPTKLCTKDRRNHMNGGLKAYRIAMETGL